MTSTVHWDTGKPAPAAGRPRGRAAGSALLDRAVDAAEARRAADIALLVAATEWAETHPVPAGEVGGYALWEHPSLHGEGAVPLAGDGAPLVAEFAADQLAAALGWPVAVARSWMGDGLELKHRLPILHGLTLKGTVAVHLARYVAEQTRDLPRETAVYADRLVTRSPARLTRARIRAWVDEARLYHDPDRAVDDERRALAARRVELWPGQTPATTEVSMTLDTLDADAFDAAVAQTAEALKALGDDDGLDIRRARAVGVLADPQRALDLLTGGTDPGAGGRAGGRAGGAVLWLHLDHSALLEIDTFPAAVRSDRFGTLSSDLVKAWLADTTVTIKPVLDLTRADAVEGHDPPGWMADLVRLRDPGCVFPGCRRPSRACDLDHIDAYLPIDEGGPPGQTRPDNLAPSADATTAPRPTPAGPTTADPTAPTGGPHRPATPTTSRPPDIPDRPGPDQHQPAGAWWRAEVATGRPWSSPGRPKRRSTRRCGPPRRRTGTTASRSPRRARSTTARPARVPRCPDRGPTASVILFSRSQTLTVNDAARAGPVPPRVDPRVRRLER